MRRNSSLALFLAAFLVPAGAAAIEIADVPDWRDLQSSRKLTPAERAELERGELALKAERDGILAAADALKADCARVAASETAKVSACSARKQALQGRLAAWPGALAAYTTAIERERAERDAEWKESDYFYALQTRTLTPMPTGGRPLDAPGAPPMTMKGLVGGTTWTYGFQRPRGKCEEKCQRDMKRNLDGQLTLFCSSQSDPKKCVADGLPFTPDLYDLAVSMGSSHSAVEDLATRVLFDGASFGEFSRQNKEIFASLKGREFATLDCHSNGAMICLAALRSGDTKAKQVRLFGPQMSPEAAKRWQEHATASGTTIEVFIADGDPVPALSWKQPTPQTPVGKAFSAAWLTNPVTGPAALADAIFHTLADSTSRVMDAPLQGYGFTVTRSDCKKTPSIDCHSMKRYEESSRAKSGVAQ